MGGFNEYFLVDVFFLSKYTITYRTVPSRIFFISIIITQIVSCGLPIKYVIIKALNNA